jgi:enterochelin esterase-like enzyme
MRVLVRSILAVLLVAGGLWMGYRAWSGPAAEVRGTLRTHHIGASESEMDHTVSVWLPPGYDTTRAEGYPVLYVQDGERLFQPEEEPDWRVDERLSRLISTGRLPPLLVVGVHSSERRLREYLPAVPFYLQPDSLRRPVQERIGRPRSNAYLQYLYEDVTMFVRRQYHVDPAASRTFIAGRGLGGLVALYAAAKMPFAFGGAAVFSPDWTPGRSGADTAFVTAYRDYLAGQREALRSVRLYFDYTTAPSERAFAPHRDIVTAFLRDPRFSQDQWTVRRLDAGASEAAWPDRVEAAIRFLMEAPAPEPSPFFQPRALRRE